MLGNTDQRLSSAPDQKPRKSAIFAVWHGGCKIPGKTTHTTWEAHYDRPQRRKRPLLGQLLVDLLDETGRAADRQAEADVDLARLVVQLVDEDGDGAIGDAERARA